MNRNDPGPRVIHPEVMKRIVKGIEVTEADLTPAQLALWGRVLDAVRAYWRAAGEPESWAPAALDVIRRIRRGEPEARVWRYAVGGDWRRHLAQREAA